MSLESSIEFVEKNEAALTEAVSAILFSLSAPENEENSFSREKAFSAFRRCSEEEIEVLARGVFYYVAADDADISLLNSQLKYIRANPYLFPFEYVAQIAITDRKGHKDMMEKTWEGETLEWGTFLKSKLDRRRKFVNGKAISYEILPPEKRWNWNYWATKRQLLFVFTNTMQRIWVITATTTIIPAFGKLETPPITLII